jgi:hypothetical protein
MKNFVLKLLLLSLFFVGCIKNKTHDSSQSFLPMQIGNYWKKNAQNYTEIQDTLTINGKLYFKFYSLIGGDAASTSYLRIDENNQLIESWPLEPTKEYIHAKFDGKVKESFFTLNDKTTNDYKVTIINKTDEKITFSFDMIYHPNIKGHPHQISYIKGQGLADNWAHIKINGNIIK